MENSDRVVKHILAQEPVCTQNDSDGDMQFVLSTSAAALSVVAAFNRWIDQSIVATGLSSYGLRVDRLTLSTEEMDHLCKAWILWRAEHCVPEPLGEDALPGPFHGEAD